MTAHSPACASNSAHSSARPHGLRRSHHWFRPRRTACSMASGAHGQACRNHRTQAQDRWSRAANRHHSQQGNARSSLSAIALRLRRHASGARTGWPQSSWFIGRCGAAQGSGDCSAGVGHSAALTAFWCGFDSGRSVVCRCACHAGRRCGRQHAPYLCGCYRSSHRLQAASPIQCSIR